MSTRPVIDANGGSTAAGEHQITANEVQIVPTIQSRSRNVAANARNPTNAVENATSLTTQRVNKRAALPATNANNTPASKKQKKGKTRGFAFSRREVDSFLDILEHFLPIGPVEWDTVTAQHADVFSSYNRSVDSLRRKFASLYRTKVPTGNPHCPPEVQRAKRINEEIKKKADIGNADDDVGIDLVENDDAEPATDLEGAMQEQDEDEEGAGNDKQTTLPTTLGEENPVLGNRRLIQGARKKHDENADLITLYKLSILEEQKERKEQRKREELRIDREREREEREALRFERMMNMMMVVFGASRGVNGGSSARNSHDGDN